MAPFRSEPVRETLAIFSINITALALLSFDAHLAGRVFLSSCNYFSEMKLGKSFIRRNNQARPDSFKNSEFLSLSQTNLIHSTEWRRIQLNLIRHSQPNRKMKKKAIPNLSGIYQENPVRIMREKQSLYKYLEKAEGYFLQALGDNIDEIRFNIATLCQI